MRGEEQGVLMRIGAGLWENFQEPYLLSRRILEKELRHRSIYLANAPEEEPNLASDCDLDANYTSLDRPDLCGEKCQELKDRAKGNLHRITYNPQS